MLTVRRSRPDSACGIWLVAHVSTMLPSSGPRNPRLMTRGLSPQFIALRCSLALSYCTHPFFVRARTELAFGEAAGAAGVVYECQQAAPLAGRYGLAACTCQTSHISNPLRWRSVCVGLVQGCVCSAAQSCWTFRRASACSFKLDVRISC